MDELRELAQVIEELAELGVTEAERREGGEFYGNIFRRIRAKCQMVTQQHERDEQNTVTQQSVEYMRHGNMVTQQPVQPTEEVQRLLDHSFRWDYDPTGRFIVRSPDIPWSYAYGSFNRAENNSTIQGILDTFKQEQTRKR